MCALYWQLNDIWQAPTWATIDFGLKWKMAHYFAKKFFDPIIVSPYINVDKSLKIFVVSDLTESLENVEIVFDVILWKQNFKPSYSLKISLSKVKSFLAEEVWSMPISKLEEIVRESFTTHSKPFDFKKDCVLRLQMVKSISREFIGPEHVLLPEDFRTILPKNYGKVEIKNVIQPTAGRTKFVVKLRATDLAPYVWLEALNVTGYFSDNGFTMTRPIRNVEFIPWTPESKLEDFKKQLTVISLADLYADID